MDLLVDSSVVIAGERGDDALARLASDASSVAISAITVAELWKSVERSESATRRSRRLATCERFLERVDVIHLDTDVALVMARLWADLERAGTPLSAFDLIIASTALAHARVLATFDRGFGMVPDLEAIDLSGA